MLPLFGKSDKKGGFSPKKDEEKDAFPQIPHAYFGSPLH